MSEEILKGIELFFKLLNILICSIYLWNSIIYLKNGSKSIHYYFYLIKHTISYENLTVDKIYNFKNRFS